MRLSSPVKTVISRKKFVPGSWRTRIEDGSRSRRDGPKNGIDMQNEINHVAQFGDGDDYAKTRVRVVVASLTTQTRASTLPFSTSKQFD